MDPVPDKTIVGDDIYNLVVSSHNTAKLKRHIQGEKAKSADDKHLQTLSQFLEQDILALLASRMAEQQPQCFSWPEYICKQPVTARDLLTPHVARFLAMMQSIEHQYVLMQRLCDMERKYGDTNAITICEEPALVAFSELPEGLLHGDPDDLDMVVVYNEDNFGVHLLVERLDRFGYNDRCDEYKSGKITNPELYGMSGENIRWCGIYHS